jgi:hypothetical protein
LHRLGAEGEAVSERAVLVCVEYSRSKDLKGIFADARARIHC